MLRIAIDGPGGAGKSSVAKELASQLGIIYVDTGALYRTIGMYMVNNGIDLNCETDVENALDRFTLELKYENGKQVILLDGADVGDSIRAPEISMAASNVSKIKSVREYLLSTQRNLAMKNSVVMDGRDIGTVILPHAEVKIFLTASTDARAKRRYDELISKGKDVSYEQVYNEMVERDTNDSTRQIAPCVPADDAVVLDNSFLSFDETVEAILKIIKKKSKRTIYMKAHKLLASPIRFFSRIKVIGAENIPEYGAVLCSNHIAAKDVIMLGVSCPRQIKFIAKKELFAIPILNSIMKSFGAIKLDRGGSDVQAIKKSVELVQKGDIVAIFPQGHRYPGINPKLTPIKHGAGLIAYRAKADVIPACIKVKNFKYRPFRRIEIIFGKPIAYDELGFKDGNADEYKRAADMVFDKIVDLGGYNNV